MQLHVGDQILIQCGTFGDRLISVVVDLVPGKHISIFLKLPPMLHERINEVRTISAQFVHESTLMGFTSKVTSYCSSPACVLQLSYPDEIEEQDPRKEKRLECNFPGTLTADGRPYRCMIENISRSGMRIKLLQNANVRVRNLFTEQTDLTLDFFVLEERNRYSFSCNLLREYITQSKRYLVLLIPQEEEAVRAILENYIQSVFGALQLPGSQEV